MSGLFLTTSSKIICPHGGNAILSTSNTVVSVINAPVLLESDKHPITGCPFTIVQKLSPCVRIEWNTGTIKDKSNKISLLINTSIGNCINGEGVVQGIAIIVNNQQKVSGR